MPEPRSLPIASPSARHLPLPLRLFPRGRAATSKRRVNARALKETGNPIYAPTAFPVGCRRRSHPTFFLVLPMAILPIAHPAAPRPRASACRPCSTACALAASSVAVCTADSPQACRGPHKAAASVFRPRNWATPPAIRIPAVSIGHRSPNDLPKLGGSRRPGTML